MKEQDTLKCTLMHKNNPVVEIMLDKVTGAISKIVALNNADRLPVGITIRNGVIDRASLNLWWGERAIPITRSGIREAIDVLKISDIRILLAYSNAFSLSDQYWILPENSELTWERLNFFRNGFSDDIGDILFGADDNPCGTDFLSPDITCDGNLKKRWKIIDGRRCLIKGGSNPYRQQPLNEVIATEIMQRLNIPLVSYTLTWSKGAPYSVCEDFIDENTELVPAWRIIQTKKTT